MNKAWPNAPSLTINVILRSFIAWWLLLEWKRRQNRTKMCQRHEINQNFAYRDWVPIGPLEVPIGIPGVPIGTFRVPIGTPNFSPIFTFFLRVFGFFRKTFYPFWTVKHFPSLLQTLWTYLNMIGDFFFFLKKTYLIIKSTNNLYIKTIKSYHTQQSFMVFNQNPSHSIAHDINRWVRSFDFATKTNFTAF